MADFEELKNELIKSYQDLLELQYHEKPKAREHIKTICESLIADMVLWKIQEQCMDVDVSVGVQLDIIGKWVDIDRYFVGKKYENNKWYAYYDWDEKDQPNSLQGGMWDWDTSEKPNNAPFLNYDWILVIKNKLNDDDFRTLIKLKIIKNNTNATCKNIDDEIYKLFKGVIYTVWGEQVFDLSKFTVVGNPTITDDGVLIKNRSDSGIIFTRDIPLNKTIEIQEEISASVKTTEQSEYIMEIIVTGATTSKPLITFYKNNKGNFQAEIKKGDSTQYLYASFLRNNEYEVGDILSIKFIIKDKNFSILALNKTTGKEYNTNYGDIFGSSTTFSSARNFRAWLGLAEIRYNLKHFSITVDDKEVFSGTKDKVMELTYKYPKNQTSIMNLAKTKNCLPCPSGVHLKMEGISDNE